MISNISHDTRNVNPYKGPKTPQTFDQRPDPRSEEHTCELQSLTNLVCRLLLEKKKNKTEKKPIRESLRHPSTYMAQRTSWTTNTGNDPRSAPARIDVRTTRSTRRRVP